MNYNVRDMLSVIGTVIALVLPWIIHLTYWPRLPERMVRRNWRGKESTYGKQEILIVQGFLTACIIVAGVISYPLHPSAAWHDPVAIRLAEWTRLLVFWTAVLSAVRPCYLAYLNPFPTTAWSRILKVIVWITIVLEIALLYGRIDLSARIKADHREADRWHVSELPLAKYLPARENSYSP